MKKEIIYLTFFVTIGVYPFAQEITTNSNAVSMEHNILFNAHQRYGVTQTGTAIVSLDKMFDGAFLPSTTTSAPSFSEPTVILIEDLPNNHTQWEHGLVGVQEYGILQSLKLKIKKR